MKSNRTKEEVLSLARANVYKMLHYGRTITFREPWLKELNDEFVGLGGRMSEFYQACSNVRPY